MNKLVVLLIFCVSINIYSQKALKSPRKAAIYSSIIPGSGQIYTKKYWKVPLIYGGLSTSIYFIHYNNSKYLKYKNTLLNRYDGIEDNLENTDSELLILKDYYRRNRDISYLATVSIYLLNIIDASVNTYLYKYDISDEISFNVKPAFYEQNIGISLNLNL